MSLVDEQGERIRGKGNQGAAEQALARIQVSGELSGAVATADPEWIVARVASDYLQYCERSVKAGSMTIERAKRQKALAPDVTSVASQRADATVELN